MSEQQQQKKDKLVSTTILEEYLLKEVIDRSSKVLAVAENVTDENSLQSIDESYINAVIINSNLKQLKEIYDNQSVVTNNTNANIITNTSQNNVTTTTTTTTSFTPISTPKTRSSSLSPSTQLERININEMIEDDSSPSSNNSSSSSSSSEEEKPKAKRGRPTKAKPERCDICGKRDTILQWRKGKDRFGNPQDLCNACGLNYLKKKKKERESREKHSINKVLNHDNNEDDNITN